MQPGQQLLQGGERGVVGHIGRGEEQGRFLAMQVGQLALQLDMVMRGAGDIARAAGARAGGIQRLVHGGQHDRVLGHAQIVVGAPDGDRPGAGVGEVPGGRELAPVAANVGEDAITALGFQRVQRRRERLAVVHQPEPFAYAGGAPPASPWGPSLDVF